jgi:dienelactone hydrolase
MPISTHLRPILPLLIVVLVLTGCSGATAAPPTAAPVAAPATATPTNVPTDVPTAAPADTPAPLPTATLPPTTAPTLTPVPTATTVPTAAPANTVTPTQVAAAASVPAAAASNPVTTTMAATRTFSTAPDPLQITVERQQSYPGSDLVIEQTLAPGSNYKQYIASYLSDGLKIYGLLTVPNGQKPASGWPVIIFNHGYIPPKQYRTTERYVYYVAAIAQSGYIVFKPDYRGHGNSQGEASGYGSPGYTDDVLNALATLQRYSEADPNRIGMWGHSMGGQVTLRAMVVSNKIKAAVIWSGVVGSYPNLIEHWTRRVPPPPASEMPPAARRWRQELIAAYGTPEQNPAFWASISPNSYVADLSGPGQLHATNTDEEVPMAFSQELANEIQAAGKTVEFYKYQGDNHNLSASFNTAMQRSIAFFNKYVKGSN